MSSSHPYYNASVPVVQGQPVSSHHHHYGGNNGSSNKPNFASSLDISPPPRQQGEGEWFHGEKQPNNCKDLPWAILFYIHLIVIGIATIIYTPLMVQDIATDYAGGAYRKLSQRFLDEDYNQQQQGGQGDETVDLNLDMNTILVIVAVSGLVGLIISSLGMTLMMTFPRPLIKIALFFNLIFTGGMAILALLSGALPLALMTGFMFLINIWYMYAVWSRIPFAAANLVTAITAIRSNMGLTFFAYNNLLITFLWSLWWAAAFTATSYILSACNPEGVCEGEINGFLVFLFFVSFFWTAQVIKNVVHVTVAGTTATWWLFPQEANGCCSQAVRESYWRSITTSFGSICLGSLIVAIIQATREIVNSLRNQDDSLLLCLADCLLGCLERLAEYFNKWAYIYVGIYGYSFVEASVNVLNLFKSRGWTAIIADTLVDTVLLMVSACVGLLTGLVGAIIGAAMGQNGATIGGAFVVGMLIGFVFCTTLFSLVSSGVNSVIVLFAESPAEFQANHPELSQQMLAAWREAYPADFNY